MLSALEKLIPRYENLPVTREEFLDLEEDGFLYDMIEGVLHLSPSPDFKHSDIAGNFYFEVRKYLQSHPIGKVVFETDVLLPDGGDVLRPDISVILNENLGIVKKHIHGAPDLIAEVLSPSTRHRDLGVKALRYLKTKVREYWIIDPSENRIEVWRNNDREWAKESGLSLESHILPGLIIKADMILVQ